MRRFGKNYKVWNIYLGKYSGWYSVSDEAYYDKDEIEETPNGKVSTVSGSSVEWVEEESYFFKLSVWSKKLLNLYDNKKKLFYLIQEKMKLLIL